MLLKNYKFYSYITTLDESGIKCYNLVIIRRDSGLPLVWVVSLKREKIKKFYKEDFHMKNLNKVLAMLVVFMMMLSTVAFASSFSDVADTSNYSTAIEVGVDLGLFKGYEDGTFKPEGEITRAEFAAIVVRLLGQEAQAAGAKAATQFIDVPADHWAAGYVNIAVQAGVINGYGNGNFGPEDLVEYQDAITMMVRALGYEPAIGSAGYPTGYLTKAGELGLTTGVNGSNGVAANRGAVAQIAFNALDVPLMTQSGYGTFTQYVINDGYSSTSGNTNVKKTLLSENHSTIKLQGTVVGSSDESSTSTTAAAYVDVTVTDGLRNKFGIGPVYVTHKDKDGEEWTELGSRKMFVGETDALNYIGKKVVLFAEYDEFEGKLTIKSLYEVNADTLVIDIADIVDFTSTEIKYYVNESKTAKVSISTGANVFYNGFAGKLNWSDWKNMSGTVELSLLNNATTDADYDTVYVTAYDVFVVDTVSATSKVVRAKFAPVLAPNRIKYDETNGDVKATLLDANGAELDWASLEEYDVLSVKYIKTDAKSIYEAKVIENVVTGTVTGISGTKGGTERYIEVDGTEYKVALKAEVEKAIKLGDEGTYYLDDNNNVVYHAATITRSNNYAMVIGVSPATSFENAKAKLLTKDAGIVTLEVANKITIGYKGDKENNVKVIDYTDKLAKLRKTVITYKVNAAGQISAIEVPSVGEKSDEYFTMSNQNASLNAYDEDRNSFKLNDGVKHYLSENTVVFYAYGEDDEDFEVVALKNLSDGDTLDRVDIYDIDEDKVMGAIVIKSSENFSPAANNATFVVKTATTTDEDGYDVCRVTGYVAGEEVAYICEDAQKPALGSLVVPVYAANGDVETFKVVTDASIKDVEEGIYGKTGTLAKYKDDGEWFSPINSTKNYIVLDDEYKVAANANVYVYDNTKTTRVKHVVDAGLDYVEFVVEKDTGATELYIDGEEAAAGTKVTAYLYFVDDDVVDVLYVIDKVAE